MTNPAFAGCRSCNGRGEREERTTGHYDEVPPADTGGVAVASTPAQRWCYNGFGSFEHYAVQTKADRWKEVQLRHDGLPGCDSHDYPDALAKLFDSGKLTFDERAQAMAQPPSTAERMNQR